MFPLLSLPIPLIEDIVKFLCPHCYLTAPSSDHWTCHCEKSCSGRDCVLEPEKRAALASLCQTNKLLNAISTPFLYHSPTHNTNLFCLFRTLFGSRRDLAQHVKTVHLGGPNDVVQARFPDDIELFKNARARIGVDSDLDFTDRVDVVPGFLGLLLATCTNIKELCVPAYYDEKLAPFSGPGSLPNLESLSVTYEDGEGGFDTEQLQDVFSAATNLRTFRAWAMVDVSPGLNLGSLREIQLNGSVVQAEGLELLLGQCPQLEKLTYFLGDATVTDEGAPSPREIQEIILDKVPRLTALELSAWENYWYDDLTDDDMIRDLKGLERLQEVRLGTDFFITVGYDPGRRVRVVHPYRVQALEPEGQCVEPEVLVDMLPVSIRKLQIGVPETYGFTDVRALVPAICRLGQVCKERFPNLAAVDIPGLTDDSKEQVRRLFKERGVTLIARD